MYMGVIPKINEQRPNDSRAPHVYGGDPLKAKSTDTKPMCSPCIWG